MTEPAPKDSLDTMASVSVLISSFQAEANVLRLQLSMLVGSRESNVDWVEAPPRLQHLA